MRRRMRRWRRRFNIGRDIVPNDLPASQSQYVARNTDSQFPVKMTNNVSMAFPHDRKLVYLLIPSGKVRHTMITQSALSLTDFRACPLGMAEQVSSCSPCETHWGSTNICIKQKTRCSPGYCTVVEAEQTVRMRPGTM